MTGNAMGPLSFAILLLVCEGFHMCYAQDLHDSVIDRFPSVRVLVVGDVMLDRFQYGRVERMSPEAPVPVFRPARMVEMPGGAGNTAVNLTSLGCQVRLIARSGTDKEAKRLAGILENSNVDVDFFHQGICGTAVKTRLIAGNNHILRIDEEQLDELDSRLAVVAGGLVREYLQNSDVVVLSDYGKGFLSAKLTARVIADCRAKGKPVLVDPKGLDFRKYAGATLVKPNLKEFSDAVGQRFDPASKDFRAALTRAARTLLARCGIDGLLITLGEYGMLHVSAKNTSAGAIHLPTQAREVFDVSGAGDTTIAALTAALGAGATMAEAMQIANAAAGVVVGKLGTATVSVDELKKVMAASEDDPRRKVLSPDLLMRKIDVLKRQGRRVGFTNGCFDCCHLGHLSSLREAKSLCDVLVVGVNSDAWIRAHKGNGRPLQDEATRTTLLASLEYVDFVVVFDDETALPLVRRLRPHVIAKEGYALKDWPEGRFVRDIGGKAVILKRVDGYSTTALAERMRKP